MQGRNQIIKRHFLSFICIQIHKKAFYKSRGTNSISLGQWFTKLGNPGYFGLQLLGIALQEVLGWKPLS